MGGSRRTTFALATVCGLWACGGSAGAQTHAPDQTVVRSLMDQNRLAGPVQIVFAWSLQEREAKFSGDGVTRVAPPDHARLDLFGPRGEGYLSAAFVSGEVRLPAGAESTPLPPPALMWSALGVFQPPTGATLSATTRDGRKTELEYQLGDERWQYRFEEGRLRRVEWTAPRGGRRTVELEGTGEDGLPAKATYRDWPQFVELRLELNEVKGVDGFPQEIWRVGRE